MTAPHALEQGGASSRIARIWRHPATTAVLALALVFALGLIFSGDGAFYKWGTHRDALRQVSVYGILACGMTVVIITAGIDLSVGSLLGLGAVSFAIFTIHLSWTGWTAIAACLAIGAALGAVSGGLIAWFRMQPFIVTLAMMVFARGLAKFLSGGQKVSTAVRNPDGTYAYVDLPPVFDAIDTRWLGGNVAVVSLVFLACVFVTWILLSRLRWGRYMYAIGGNEEAARLSGVPVRGMKVLAYGLSGFFAAIAGVLQAAQETQGDPEAGVTYELTAIAIVVIGGTNLMGGSGGVGLTLLGALTIGYIEKILSINAVKEAWRLMITGAIIVTAVLMQRRK